MVLSSFRLKAMKVRVRITKGEETASKGTGSLEKALMIFQITDPKKYAMILLIRYMFVALDLSKRCK